MADLVVGFAQLFLQFRMILCSVAELLVRLLYLTQQRPLHLGVHRNRAHTEEMKIATPLMHDTQHTFMSLIQNYLR